MKKLTGLLVFCACIVPFGPAGAASDDDHSSLDAHVHGHGTVNIAIEGNNLAIELEAPGADIVGFEHAAVSDEDKAALAASLKRLEAISTLIMLPEAAGCTQQSAGVERHGDHEDDHDHAKKSAENEEKSHTEIHAEYSATCTAPEKLTSLTFSYFQNFEKAQELVVTVIGPAGQARFEVSRQQPRVALGGIM